MNGSDARTPNDGVRLSERMTHSAGGYEWRPAGHHLENGQTRGSGREAAREKNLSTLSVEMVFIENAAIKTHGSWSNGPLHQIAVLRAADMYTKPCIKRAARFTGAYATGTV